MFHPVPIAPGPVVLGRDEALGLVLPDEKMSRRHAELSFDGPGWTVKDLGSRNGTFVNGTQVSGEMRAAPRAVVRLANSLFVLCDDLRPFMAGCVSTEGPVIGPTLRAQLDRIAVAARGGSNVLIGGETGAGKELAATTFHSATGRKGPLTAVNCANIAPTMAERLLFGAVKGAYTDLKADTDGYLQAANGGTLFLDEVGELDLTVQAKLLRAIENHEVIPLGASSPQKISVRFCAATHRNLRRAVDAGAFRSDLFFRLAQVEVTVPRLRDRVEEIPHLIVTALAEQPVRVAHVLLVEAALQRPWPGNVRELLAAMRRASLAAQAEGSKNVRDVHLEPNAGVGGTREEVATQPLAPAAAPVVASNEPSKDAVLEALKAAGSVVSRAQRTLGIKHRTQMYRLMDKYGITREKSGDDEQRDDPKRDADDDA